ncbi:hemerythrin domain-containing protein [Protofrankia coriariae]|uniref:hemerythrin domain-containing protein n=1 Tax=Protofrankia coriariae TaxID=1562887 RepID=UPI0006996F50|nr:hemerythrin domain-containing protein [Protofrankia coriariae]
MTTAAGSGGARPEDPAGARPERTEKETGSGERAQPAASLLGLVRAAHDHIDDLVARTFSAVATSEDPRRPLRAADTAVAAISAHMYAVQTAVYPVARRHLPPAGQACATELRMVARETESVTRGISQYIQGDMHQPNESMRMLRERLAELGERHVALEESMLADLDEVLSGPERRRAASAFERSVRRAPTRSHPHLPRTIGIGGLMLRVAGSWDHVLDAMDARVAAETPPRTPVPVGLWGWYLLGGPAPASQPEQAMSGERGNGQREVAQQIQQKGA